MYVFLGEDEKFALGLPAGYLAARERPEIDGETTNDIGEKANTEPDDKGKKDNYTPGVEYDVTTDALNPMYVIKDPRTGRTYTVKYESNTNGKPIDTARQK